MRIILLLLFCPVLAFAEVHKCVNDGKVTYTQERCVSGAAVYDAARASIGESRVSSVTLLRGANGVFNLSGFVNGKSADFIVDTVRSIEFRRILMICNSSRDSLRNSLSSLRSATRCSSTIFSVFGMAIPF